MRKALSLLLSAALLLPAGPLPALAQRFSGRAAEPVSQPGLGPAAPLGTGLDASSWVQSPGGLWLPDSTLTLPVAAPAAALPSAAAPEASPLAQAVALERDLFLGNPRPAEALRALAEADRPEARIALTLLASPDRVAAERERLAQALGAENVGLLEVAGRHLEVLARFQPEVRAALERVGKIAGPSEWGRFFDGAGSASGETPVPAAGGGLSALQGALLLERAAEPASPQKTHFLPSAPAPAAQPAQEEEKEGSSHRELVFLGGVALGIAAPLLYRAIPPEMFLYMMPVAMALTLTAGLSVNLAKGLYGTGRFLVDLVRGRASSRSKKVALGLLAAAAAAAAAYPWIPSVALIYYLPTIAALAFAAGFVLLAAALLLYTTFWLLYKAALGVVNLFRRRGSAPRAKVGPPSPAPKEERPLGRRLARPAGYAALLALGAALGLAPLALVGPVVESLPPAQRAVGRWLSGHPWLKGYEAVQEHARELSEKGDVHALGPAFSEEAIRVLSENPEGRKTLERLKDRGGVLRPPTFFIGHQEHAAAFQMPLYHAVFIDPRYVEARGWTLEEFLASPDKQRELARDMAQVLAHELVHAEQSYRRFRLGNNLEIEFEAHLREHLFLQEELKRDLQAEIFDPVRYQLFLDDIDGFLDWVAVQPSYKDLKHVETPEYRAFLADLRVRHPAVSVEGYMLLAKRDPHMAWHFVDLARRKARAHGLPEPTLASVYLHGMTNSPNPAHRLWAGSLLVQSVWAGDASGAEAVAALRPAAQSDPDAANRAAFTTMARDLELGMGRRRAFYLEQLTGTAPTMPRDMAWDKLREMIARKDASAADVAKAYLDSIAAQREPRLRAFFVEDLGAKLGDLGAAPQSARDALTRISRDDESPVVRAAAARALGHLGP